MTVDAEVHILVPLQAWPVLHSADASRQVRASFFEHARRAYSGARKRTLKRARFLVRALCSYRLHDAWLRLLETPALSPMMIRQPLMCAKIQHDYVLSGLKTADRLALARGHFETFLRRVPRTLTSTIYVGTGLLLATIEADGVRYELRLLHLPHCWQEGEVSLGLFDEGALVCSGTFVLGQARDFSPELPDAPTLFIGGIQGFQGSDGQGVFRRATKAMHGLRPFSLLIHASRSLSRSLGAARLLAVADARHALRYKRAKQRIRLSYDELWLEHGATAACSGVFDLGTNAAPKDLVDVPSHKRAQYRRRHALMESVDAQIRAALVLLWLSDAPQ